MYCFWECSRQTDYSLINLIIIWLVNPMVYFVGGFGDECLEKIIQLIMVIFSHVIIFHVTSISILYIRFIGKNIFFYTMYHKIVIDKYIMKGFIHSLLNSSNHPPFIVYDIATSIYLGTVRHKYEHLVVYPSWDYLKVQEIACVLLYINLMGMK